MMIMITPITKDMSAFTVAPPGKLINRSIFGFNSVPMPRRTIIAPTIIKIKFGIAMVSI